MDVIKNNRKKKSKLFNNSIKFFLLAGILLLCALYFFNNKTYSIPAENILVAEVKRGKMKVTVDGFGVLESEHHLLLTSRTAATVKEILLKPGAHVTVGSEIVRLENPELEQAQFAAKQTLAMAKADHSQLQASQARELLIEQGQLEELKARYETAKLRRIAQQKLAEKGIISQFDFTSGQLLEQQLFKQLGLIKSRLEQLKTVHAQAIQAEKNRVELAKARLTVISQNIERLVIRADMPGVLQRLPISLGQSLVIGQEIALIGSVHALKALIRVPQTQIQKIEIGQKAEVSIHTDNILGKVTRIDPVVTDNTVTVEIALTQALPQSARPQLNINGKIITTQITNTFYMQRPSNAKEQGSMDLFKLHNEGDEATRENVSFGHFSGNLVELSSNVEAGARYIISGLPETAKSKQTLLIK